jgi:hypothetical protein
VVEPAADPSTLEKKKKKGKADVVRVLRRRVRVAFCRFLHVTPMAIVAVAFDGSGRQLAVARADASIELWMRGSAADAVGVSAARGWAPVVVRCTVGLRRRNSAGVQLPPRRVWT